MCQDCYRTSAAAVSMSLAMTNPELIWPHHQDNKRQSAHFQPSKTQTQTKAQSDVKPSSASTYSESTTYSYDKEKSHGDAKQKRSMRQRIKETFKDIGNSPTEKYDRKNGQKTEDLTTYHGPMSSSTQGRT
ncbi:hypothetical protein F4813DRAFT_356565 [Daldinia decipiens]|uniref:uncharacterized protein n=1 Tax=Daldinia decipiens TaxID=326647 RepID=UPI0020C45E93|nr:uncharacterized protein F4813DRAFT_356565 [Daldinia decipiens]KAI1658357.1 hypothetical protein F4813DRAFT_356565 [Daldinia decipiens]